MIRHFLEHRITAILLMSLPAIALTIAWSKGEEYGRLMHGSGEFAARFLVFSLLLTPLLGLLPGRVWLRWLRVRRRQIGITAFLYTLLHMIIYLAEKGTLSAVAAELSLAVVWTGWLPAILMTPLALTSSDRWVRRLGANWFTLHRLAYPATVLSAAHWYLVSEKMAPVLVHFAPLAVLEVVRYSRTRTRK